jgi:hypothetical protein
MNHNQTARSIKVRKTIVDFPVYYYSSPTGSLQPGLAEDSAGKKNITATEHH